MPRTPSPEVKAPTPPVSDSALSPTLGLALGLVLLLTSCAASRLIGYRIAPDAPGVPSSVQVRGLEAPVRVVYDRYRVPHVEAAGDRDLMFAMGYVQARDRLFQMEMLRRIATGRIAELLGNHGKAGQGFGDTLALDRWFRVFGMTRAARKTLAALPGGSRALLQAYVAGINEAIRTLPLPLEYRLIDAVPEPWTAEQVLAIVRLNAWDLSLNLPQELIRHVVRTGLGPEFQEEAFPPFDHPGPYVIERSDRDYRREFPKRTGPAAGLPVDDDAWGPTSGALLSSLAPVEAVLRSWAQPASNNWVIGPSRSASGKPILANDPHLSHGAPATFFMVHLSAPGLDAAGVTLPGTPVISLGHNRHIAWAATTTFADVQDVYLEQTDPADPGRYRTPGGFEPFTVVDSPILEKTGSGTKVHPFRLRFTRHGVVLNDAAGDLLPPDAPVLVLRSTLEEPADEVAVMLDVARAGDAQAWRNAMSRWAVPIMNWLVADDAGHIGYLAAGKVPRRTGWDGTRPVPGWTGEFEWAGWIPREDLPQLWDPPSGRIVTANNKVVPPGDYPWPFTLDPAPGYRAARIVERLDAQAKWTVEDVRRLQTDTYSKQADRLLPALLAAVRGLDPDPRERAALDRLAAWDRDAAVDSVGATIFFVTYREAWELALRQLPPAATKVSSVFGYVHGFFDRLWAEHPGARIWDLKDTPGVEDRDAILRLAFRKAVAGLSGALGRDVARWTWGRVHQVRFEHPFGGPDGLSSDFDVGPRPLPGSDDSIWAAGGTTYGPDCRIPVQHGPVFRQVIDLAAPEEAGMVLDLGQSGWPRTAGYSNALEDWTAGRLWNVPMDPDGYERESIGVLDLRP